MSNNIKYFKNKITLTLSILNTEYINIINQYNENNLYIKSLPLKPSKHCSTIQKEKIKKQLEDMFIPILKELSPIIDNGIIELECVEDTIPLSSISKSSESYKSLIYESWDRLYTYKYIKYNIIMDFIMQLYLVFEKELCNYTKKELCLIR